MNTMATISNLRLSMGYKKKKCDHSHTCSFCVGTMLIGILGHYAKMPHVRGTLWKTELKMAQIIAWLFDFHSNMVVLRMTFCYT